MKYKNRYSKVTGWSEIFWNLRRTSCPLPEISFCCQSFWANWAKIQCFPFQGNTPLHSEFKAVICWWQSHFQQEVELGDLHFNQLFSILCFVCDNHEKSVWTKNTNSLVVGASKQMFLTKDLLSCIKKLINIANSYTFQNSYRNKHLFEEIAITNCFFSIHFLKSHILR